MYLDSVNATKEAHVATSYNGWPASPTLSIRPLVVAGESFVPGVLDDDDVFTVLQYVAEQMHERVERIWAPGWHEMDDWGFNYRETRGEDSMSCHASATAVDYNATRHPRLVPASSTFTYAQIAEIRKIVAEAGVIRWGGEWENVPDAMHFEIMGNRAEVAAAAARIREMKEDEMKPEDFERIKEIVVSNTPSGEQVREIVREEIDAQMNEQVTVRTSSGERRISYTQLLREVWQKINKHT
jgi:hypothetical protein